MAPYDHRLSGAPAAAVRISGLTRSFGKVRAVDGVDITVAPGERLGLLGPNGAGKTTTLLMLLGAITPDRGSIEIAGHRHFTRDGNNIRLTLPVTLKEAVLGAKVKVPTPEGAVMLSIPKGTTSGKVFRLKGRGFTAKDGTRGDQLIAVEVDVPADDEELKAFAERWDGGGNPRSALGV